MRGEHDLFLVLVVGVVGSSPHARGTPEFETVVGEELGDHPRMRGEHRSESREGQRKQGSSPHARGTRHALEKHQPHVGIIPACAGNTISKLAYGDVYRDHPRMRGEHIKNKRP